MPSNSENSKKKLLELIGVSKCFQMAGDTFYALKNVDLDINVGEYIAIIGSSGSGKSTLMNILGCLDTPSSGSYLMDGQDIGRLEDEKLAKIRNQHVGFVFQNFNLMPRLNALQNVMQPLTYQYLPIKERKERARIQLEKVGLGDKLSNLPNQLSGGQKQRVAIARALVTQPKILLGDEPTGNLDSTSTREIMALFDELNDAGKTVILITHENDIANHCHRQIRLQDGQLCLPN